MPGLIDKNNDLIQVGDFIFYDLDIFGCTFIWKIAGIAQSGKILYLTQRTRIGTRYRSLPYDKKLIKLQKDYKDL